MTEVVETNEKVAEAGSADGHTAERVLTDKTELLWRNAHPAWFDDRGRLTSQVFRPTPKDQSKLSGARAVRVTAEEHFREFTEVFQLESSGVWAVSVEEAEAQGLRAVCDEGSPGSPNPCPKGHTYLDFAGHSGGQTKRIGGVLRDCAEKRGCQYSPAPPES